MENGMNNRITQVLKKLGLTYNVFGNEVIEIKDPEHSYRKTNIIIVDDKLELVRYQIVCKNVMTDRTMTYDTAIQRLLDDNYATGLFSIKRS